MPPGMDRLLRLGPLVLALIGCVLLVVAEFTTLTAVQIITVERGALSGGSNHSYALLIIAVPAAFMAWGATFGGSRPAAWALLALAVAAIAIILAVDLPDVSEEGLIGEAYEQAKASPKTGFYLESLGAALLLIAAVATLLLRPDRPVDRGPDRTRDGTPPAGTGEQAAGPPAEGDAGPISRA